MDKQQYIEQGGERCPKCGSINLSAEPFEAWGRTITCNVACSDCEAEWRDVYTLTGIEPFEEMETQQMKAQLVTVEISVEGYEKRNSYLITDIPEEHVGLAFDFACTLEAHNQLEDTNGEISDGGVFFYTPGEIEDVDLEDVETLSKYMRPWKFDIESAQALELK